MSWAVNSNNKLKEIYRIAREHNKSHNWGKRSFVQCISLVQRWDR